MNFASDQMTQCDLQAFVGLKRRKQSCPIFQEHEQRMGCGAAQSRGDRLPDRVPGHFCCGNAIDNYCGCVPWLTVSSIMTSGPLVARMERLVRRSVSALRRSPHE